MDDMHSEVGNERAAEPLSPPTSRDDLPVTTVDQPVTSRDDPPVTTVDQPAPTPDEPTGRYRRVNLPPALLDRYFPDRDLAAGGEADLMLVRDRISGTPAVIRIYRRGDAVDSATLDILRRADRRHLISLLDWGRSDGVLWEVLEYAAGGSLADLRRERPGPWTDGQVREVLDQLLPALEYVHSLQLVHRDLKPDNVLVRSVEPFDLVLADFGLTTMVAATHEMRQTTSRTLAYAAPEAAAGDTWAGLDWWALGILLVELLTGRHPFQRLDGSWMDDRMIAREMAVREIDLSLIRDERWLLLCRGLLTRAPEQRWGAAQVRRWCAGGAPTVAGPSGPVPSGPSGPVFVFADTAYSSPQELADAFRRRWTDARRLLAGQAYRTPQFLALRDWAATCQLTAAVRALDEPSRPDRAVTRLIHALDPEGVAVYCQRPMDRDNLVQLAQQAIEGPGAARDIIVGLHEDGILTVLDGRPGCAGYALIDSRWRRLGEGFTFRARELDPSLTKSQRAMYLAMLLLAAFPGQDQMYARQAEAAAAEPDARAQAWFAALADQDIPAESRPAHHVMLLHLAPLAADRTARERADREIRQAEEDRQRKLSRRQTLDVRSGPLAVVCGVLACWLARPEPVPLGPVSAPWWLLAGVAIAATFYLGYRTRRGGRRKTSFVAFACGVIAVLMLYNGLGGQLPLPG